MALERRDKSKDPDFPDQKAKWQEPLEIEGVDVGNPPGLRNLKQFNQKNTTAQEFPTPFEEEGYTQSDIGDDTVFTSGQKTMKPTSNTKGSP